MFLQQEIIEIITFELIWDAWAIVKFQHKPADEAVDASLTIWYLHIIKQISEKAEVPTKVL